MKFSSKLELLRCKMLNYLQNNAFTWYKIMTIHISSLHKHAFTAAQIPLELHMCWNAR